MTHTFKQNKWNDIRRFYRWALPYIMEEREDEWGIDPYEWDAQPIIFFTPIETALWADIRALNAIFYPQFPIGNVFVDFANPKAKVALECDGAAYHDEEADAKRDAALREKGWRVYRFPGWLCVTDQDRETGKSGEAHVRLREICENNNLIRGCTQSTSGTLRCASDFMEQVKAEFARGRWWDFA